MLADVVALMLTFFVLGFSMRVPAPEWQTGTAAEEMPRGRLAAPTLTADAMPPLAYLAAIIEAEGAQARLLSLRHDDARLIATLAGEPPGPATVRAGDGWSPLGTMAFLARRYGLDLALTLPSAMDAGDATRLLALRDRLVRTAGLADVEIVFPAASRSAAAEWSVALAARPPSPSSTGYAPSPSVPR